MAQLSNGKALAQQIQTTLTQQIQTQQSQLGRPPGLARLMVGDNPTGAAYGRGKERACERLGSTSPGQYLLVAASQADLTRIMARLRRDERVDGILVQLPLPDRLNSAPLLNEIDPDKDADGLHPTNLGRLLRGEPGLRRCRPAGVMQLMQFYDIDLKVGDGQFESAQSATGVITPRS